MRGNPSICPRCGFHENSHKKVKGRLTCPVAPTPKGPTFSIPESVRRVAKQFEKDAAKYDAKYREKNK